MLSRGDSLTWCSHAEAVLVIGSCLALVSNVVAGYVKVVNGRCEELEGALPLGAPGRNWTRDLDALAREWCDRQSWCVGYMRYLGDDPLHCEAWCGRPQFCGGAALAHDEHWAAYLSEAKLYGEGEGAGRGADDGEISEEEGQAAMATAVVSEPLEVVCPWPHAGSLTLFFEEPLADSDISSSGSDDECRVLHHRRGQAPPRRGTEEDAGSSFFHGILSEDTEVIPYFTADVNLKPWVYSVDGNEYIGETVESGGAGWGPKKHFLSIFYLSPDSVCDGQEPGRWTPEVTEDAMPGHVFVDDGSAETRRQAFNPYHFTVICGRVDEARFVPQALVDALGFATHPLILNDVQKVMHRAFFHLPDAAQPYTRIHPRVLEKYVENMYMDPDKNEAMYFKQTFLFLLQDLFRYRLRQALPQRLEAAACALCEDRRKKRKLLLEGEGSDSAPRAAAEAVGVAVCVMSRRSGHALRGAIRETWAQRVLATGGAALRFFVGSGDGVEIEDGDAGDVVELNAPEAYKAVTLKAFSMLAWAHRVFPNLRFLVRSDDDVYLRPGPLFAQLERRPPVSYLWGNFDHGSNPVRDPEHAHYNSYEQFPQRKHPLFGDIFPPYARGHLWAMSADLLARVVDVWRGELLRHPDISLELASRLPHPDDPALGVALSSLVEEDGVSVNIDDRDLNVFSLNPACNATYLNIHRRTWVVHHVDIAAMHCMWSIDAEAGEEAFSSQGPGPPDGLPDLCPCSMDVVEEVMEGPDDVPFDYPRDRFNE